MDFPSTYQYDLYKNHILSSVIIVFLDIHHGIYSKTSQPLVFLEIEYNKLRTYSIQQNNYNHTFHIKTMISHKYLNIIIMEFPTTIFLSYKILYPNSIIY